MSGPESLRRQDRIRRRVDYQRCYRKGHRLYGSLLTVHAIRSTEGGPRLGTTAMRKVGPAVVRQRLRRRTKEIFRRWPGRASLPAKDIVVHFKPAAAQATFAELRDELQSLLARISARNREN